MAATIAPLELLGLGRADLDFLVHIPFGHPSSPVMSWLSTRADRPRKRMPRHRETAPDLFPPSLTGEAVLDVYQLVRMAF